MFDLSSYLDRLGTADISVTPDGLARLQSAQIRHIPFENIDPFLGIEPNVDPTSVAAKIIASGRGGYCFELNQLFLAALEAAGFRVGRRLARVRMGADKGGARSHLALVCDFDGDRFLADAGFGGPAPLEPLALDDDGEQVAPNGHYVLRTDAISGERVLYRQSPDADFSLYGFDESFVGTPDIQAANFLCSTWAQAPFPNHLMVNGYDGDTRIGLFDRHMTLESHGSEEKRSLATRGELGDTLCERLGLRLKGATVDAVWQRIA